MAKIDVKQVDAIIAQLNDAMSTLDEIGCDIEAAHVRMAIDLLTKQRGDASTDGSP